jgi:hypothetical protein
VVVFRFVSQPLALFPSQSPNPALQLVYVQAPAPLHAAPEALTTVVAQLVPHTPQFAVVVLRFVSQPLALFPSQSPNPALQLVYVHAPVPLHAAPEALATVVAQLVPHTPQFAVVVFRFVSQPLALFPSQSPNPALQLVYVHAPVPLHAAPEALATVVAQLVPHEPQFAALVFVLVSQPLALLPSQSPNPAVQLVYVQAPVPQLIPDAFCTVELHTVEHEPQWFASLCELTSQPSSGAGAAGCAQLRNPTLHADVHRPPEQVGVATFAPLQPRPQAPQLVVDDERSVSQPFRSSGSPSQSPNVPLQPVYEHTPLVEQLAPVECVESQSPAVQQPPDGTQPTPGHSFCPAPQVQVLFTQLGLPLAPQSEATLQHPAAPDEVKLHEAPTQLAT